VSHILDILDFTTAFDLLISRRAPIPGDEIMYGGWRMTF
jgi:hypothetical protein